MDHKISEVDQKALGYHSVVTRTESIWNQTLVTFLTTWCVFFVNRSIEIAIFKFRSYLKSIDPPNCDGKSFWFTHSPFLRFQRKIQKNQKWNFSKNLKKNPRNFDESEGLENFPKCSWLVITLIPVSYP